MEFEHRGVVEGFYGPPWPHEDRLWMLERLGRWGMNRYVYAPKNDPLHRDRWREPYPEAMRSEFAELVRAGERAGVSVAFALSPGLSIRYSSDADVALLAEKFRGFRALGARWLALFLDDVPSELAHEEDRAAFPSLADAHVALATRVQEALGPDVSWMLCPTDYLGTRPSAYLETLGAGLEPDVLVGWTGRTVCSPSITRTEAAARSASLHRRLLVWDNVPVSDGPMRAMLHLGPYARRDAELPQHVAGVLLNPMQHARASGVAIRTAAAYLSDPARYDPEAAWQEALAEIGEGAPRAFSVFAEAHRFSPIWPEDRDRELEGALVELRGALSIADDVAHRHVERMRPLLAERLAAGDVLRKELADRRLAAEIEPWIVSHRVETQRMGWALDAVSTLTGAGAVGRKATALFGLELRLGSEPEPRHVSYGPRRVLYPQLASMFEDEMRLGPDPALYRDRCLSDAFVALAEELALARLAPDGEPPTSNAPPGDTP